MTVIDTILEIAQENPSLTNAQIAEEVSRRSPGLKTTAASVASLKSRLRKRGVPLKKTAMGTAPARGAKISLKSTETDISASVGLDGTGFHDNRTGIGFFDHMLDQLARHSLMDIAVRAEGDLHIDDHHTVEDTGIALGRAFAKALGDKRGIRRYGSCLLPMDDALVRAALDVSGRPFLAWNVAFSAPKIGAFDVELVREFFHAFAMNGGVTLHVEALAGHNAHHLAEACFKSVAQAIRAAVEPDPRRGGTVPSTKGRL